EHSSADHRCKVELGSEVVAGLVVGIAGLDHAEPGAEVGRDTAPGLAAGEVELECRLGAHQLLVGLTRLLLSRRLHRVDDGAPGVGSPQPESERQGAVGPQEDLQPEYVAVARTGVQRPATAADDATVELEHRAGTNRPEWR